MASNKSKKTDLSTLDDAALASRTAAEVETMQRAVFSHSIAAIENPMSIRTQRRNVARLLTEKSARKNKA